jgi:hypothetical protein
VIYLEDIINLEDYGFIIYVWSSSDYNSDDIIYFNFYFSFPELIDENKINDFLTKFDINYTFKINSKGFYNIQLKFILINWKNYTKKQKNISK